MALYISHPDDRQVWSTAFIVNKWLLLYSLWPIAMLIFAAWAGDGRFRQEPVQVFNCTIVNTPDAQDLNYYPMDNDANDTAVEEAPAFLFIQRPEQIGRASCRERV